TAEVEAVADWDAASPCEGWRARDVLAHVIDTEQEFLTRVGLAPEGASGPTTQAPRARWRDHRAAVDALLADPAIAGRPHGRAVGPTTVGAVLSEFSGFVLVAHRWYLARSQGREVRFDAQELSLLDASVDSWGEHAYAPGVFGSPLELPEGADAQTRVLARVGRRG